ncbi:hypothetical protein CN680_20490 [Bacillus pseudomycoides]|uniref:Uncharacterized protein n=1 Tax=Bacillus pseudomycoides TaxID=64104 RepID=A0A2A8C418_9BACI|nr:hypothetical protein [Bacillus pseudomycoides]PEA84728.1 hypothetical protein CON99_05310 [Bacillus pseudomycoides]PED71561.1 hypothetical protein CON97_12925 [Bacillus pseudomycoides]PEI40309.1 hypothetical protein CN620_15535 [Bacillus pseudomycoides]PEJ73234.1 hypothetical protein CN680_20490 [Bacillus pseudomycoides]PEM19796.1 hypothetical protein CN628_06630 [Bacillus pseudomycoides]
MDINEILLKSSPALVTAIVALFGSITFIIQRTILLSATSEFDMLFINKEQQKKIRLIGLIVLTIIGTLSIYITPGLFFYKAYSDFLLEHRIISTVIAGLSFLIFLGKSYQISRASLNVDSSKETKKHITKLSIHIFLSSLGWYYILIIFCIENATWLEVSLLGILAPLCTSAYFIYPLIKIQRLERKKYSVRILKRDEIDSINLIHKYTIDEKRTLCTAKDLRESDIFYVCDFSSEVYLEYKDVSSIKVNQKNN